MDALALKKNFRCIRCGNSCRLRVKVTEQDIKRIQNAPYVKSEKLPLHAFAEPDDFDPATGNHSLRMADGGCIFLGQDGISFSCNIYEHRPEICRLYPFIGGSVLPCSAIKTEAPWQKP